MVADSLALQASRPPARLSRGKRKVLIAAALSLALAYVVVAVITDSDKLWGALQRLGWLGCGSVLGLSVLNYALRFLRWQSFMRMLGHRLPPGRHLLYYLGGFAFTVSPAKAGEALRSLYLKDHGVSYAESFAAFFVERLLDLFAMVLIASLITLDYPAYAPLVVASFGVVMVIVACVGRPALPAWIERFGQRRRGRLREASVLVANLLRSSSRLLAVKPLAAGAAVGLIAWGAEAAGFGVVCHGLHLDGSLTAFGGIYAIAILAGTAAIFLPAGIGGTEIVMTTLLVQRGTELPVAVIATLLCRLATLWFAVIIGIVAATAIEVMKGDARG